MSKKPNFEIEDIGAKLDVIHTDIKAFIEDSNRHQLESILAFVRSEYTTVLENHLVANIEMGLSKNMVKNCERMEQCKSVFTDLLQKNAALIKQPHVDVKLIDSKRVEIKTLGDVMPYDKCETCLSEVSDLLETQIDLMQSLKVYETNADKEQDISDVKSESMVNDVLEPLCNITRFDILKAVSSQPMSFSSLSKLTGLRGGNLFFHLQKLLDSRMIIQQHERGDYMITGKGFRLMEETTKMYSIFVHDNS